MLGAQLVFELTNFRLRGVVVTDIALRILPVERRRISFSCASRSSGGGTRAAALAYGAMIALRQTHIDWPHRGETLLQN